MSRSDHTDRLTVLLRRSAAGDEHAGDELFRLVFDDLHRIARGLMRHEQRHQTLQPTALIGEAWLRLAGAELDWRDRAHFFHVAARAMRRAIIDYVRARNAGKRDAGERIAFEELADAWDEMPYELLDLHEALNGLAEVDAELARIVELRFFAGLSLAETGELCGMTFQQVHRAWNLARGWLHRRLRSADPSRD
ncbi:MAG: sigma-70 family RNA polymerase sigma factor [Planctomycetes bacterium]|nr:sigma-70 family RNA polymerase sigma factor [Planctomycetota bacterium]